MKNVLHEQIVKLALVVDLILQEVALIQTRRSCCCGWSVGRWLRLLLLLLSRQWLLGLL